MKLLAVKPDYYEMSPQLKARLLGTVGYFPPCGILNPVELGFLLHVPSIELVEFIDLSFDNPDTLTTWIDKTETVLLVQSYDNWRCVQYLYPSLLDTLKILKEIGFKGEIWSYGPFRPPKVKKIDTNFVRSDIIPDISPSIKYSYFMGEGWKGITGKHVYVTFTSIGCAYNCTFCCRKWVGHKLFSRSPKKVVSELQNVADAGVKKVAFLDECFGLNWKQTSELCKLMVKNGLNDEIDWEIQTRTDVICAENQFQLLAEAGCKGIVYGVEHISQKVLDSLNKQLNAEKAINILDAALHTGFKVSNCSLIGTPGDDEENVDLLKEWLDQSEFECEVMIATPLWHTQLAKETFGTILPTANSVEIYERAGSVSMFGSIGCRKLWLELEKTVNQPSIYSGLSKREKREFDSYINQ